MSCLFEPVQLGGLTLKNRIVMAPLTRTRAGSARVPNELMRQYYCQRAGAGLVISEATSVSAQGVGYPGTPGIWSKTQVEGWKRITKTVHDQGGKIMLQLWHVGRVSDPELLNGEIPVAPSAIPCEGHVSLLRPKRPYPTPRALHLPEIASIVADFTQAARNAREAGFDGVEIHAANGYLIDQFLHNHSNRRTDHYGGPVENRARFLMEVVQACCSVWPSSRVGVHLSPRGDAHSMGDDDPQALFSYVAQALGEQGLAFLCVRESEGPDSLLPRIKALFGGPVIANENFNFESAEKMVSSGQAEAVAFGRSFIANPDLVERFRRHAPLNEPIAQTFYGDGACGYTDYPALEPLGCDQEVA
ncbi:MAG TPA: alkene reductase [Pusillimonas sp.]|jgi:2,4-dienoyl-CoA reductase-like NADH-dependent reductase (Old Yellow Enzyme family)|nr:alkene reductase [Pusillimonas sp.]|tara:strand:+ start:10318 stop:11397 length:1080 start_codon:yes stop_codon:yes gene_type:complete